MHKAKTLVLALASLLGRWRGETLTLANAKGGHDWKAMHAEAIGLGAGKTDMPDDEQVAAHHAHMALVNSMDDDAGADFPTAMDNAKKEEATALLNTAITEGRIAEDDRPAWCGKFGADFDAAKTELAAVKKPEPENEELANAKKQANAMRKEATDLLLGNAITAGKITQAQRADWETKFAADFDGTKTALANAKPTVKVTPQTSRLGERQNDIVDAALTNEKDRALKVKALVAEKQKTVPDYMEAFNAVMRENPALFNSMTQPEPKK